MVYCKKGYYYINIFYLPIVNFRFSKLFGLLKDICLQLDQSKKLNNRNQLPTFVRNL